MNLDLNPFPRLSPSGHHVCRGSGRVAVDGDVIPLASAWAHDWLNEEEILVSGNTAVSDNANGTYHYSCTSGLVTKILNNGWNELHAGGGVWSAVTSGVRLKHVDGRILLGQYYDPRVESTSSYAYTKVGTNGRKALYWNDRVVETRGCVAPNLHDGILTWQISTPAGLETWGMASEQDQPARWNVAGPQYGSQGLRADGKVWVLVWDDYRLFLHEVGKTTGILIATGMTKDAVAALVTGAGNVRVAWWGSVPNEKRIELDAPQIDLLASPPVEPPHIPAIGRPCWVWYFKALSNTVSDAGPDYPTYRALPGHGTTVEANHQFAESGTQWLFPSWTLLPQIRPHRSRVVAIMCHGSTPAELSIQGKQCHAMYPRIPTLGVCDWPVQVGVGRINHIDQVMLEVYPTAGESPAQTEARLARVIAGTPYPRIHLVQLSYDQNGRISYPTLVAHQGIADRLAKRFSKVIGIGIFAANRADGLRKYPELVAYHRQLAAGVPAHPPLIRL